MEKPPCVGLFFVFISPLTSSNINAPHKGLKMSKQSSQKNIFCFGMGYVTGYLKNTYATISEPIQSFSIKGTSRTAIQNLEDESELISFFDAPSIAKNLKKAAALLISTPPSTEGCPTFLTHRDHIKKHTDQNTPIVYLSSTSVYGNHDGATVDETTPCAPTSEAGHNRVRAERQWI